MILNFLILQKMIFIIKKNLAEAVSLILFSTSSFKINDTGPGGIIDFEKEKMKD